MARAEQQAEAGVSRIAKRQLSSLRGAWYAAQQQWQPAADSFRKAVEMAREAGQHDATAETGLALARLQLGQLADPRAEAEQLSSARQVAALALAELWLAIGDQEQARTWAVAAYEKAWNVGEPYVYRYELNQATRILNQLGVPLPQLPAYDPAKVEKRPWEADVEAAIAKLRAEQEDEQA